MTRLNTNTSALLANTDLLTVFIGYHASADLYPTEAALLAAGPIKTLTNQTITVTKS